MSVLQICLLFAGISFCLAFAVLSRSMFAHLSLRFFLLYLLLKALNFGFEWLLVHPDTPYKAAWLALLMASSFLMAPCVWLLAREIDRNAPPRLWPIAWGQSAVVLAGFILCIPLFLAANQSVLLVDPSRAKPHWFNLTHTTMVGAVLLYLAQVPWYLSRSVSLFRERLRINKFLFSNIDEPALNALRALIWVMAASWLFNLLRMLHTMILEPSQVWNLLISASEIGVTITALYVIFKRCWQYSVDDQTMVESVSPGLKEQASHLQNDKGAKYAKSSLDQTTRTRVAKKILAQFEEEKIYRKNGLKLQDLCAATNENAHYISQVINQELGLSFFDLVNKYRIEEAQQKLKQNRDLPILDIALEVGFNSKPTFNKAFKLRVGQTPSEFRAM
ncbi:helix-turn-helix domain-containing protein [Saccharophagus degradans]|uniref:helix-turn-helix domain-containing protein n=1 Tax=Saccharophagus degradans TaxID=86304 RepID=UPI001C08AACD|nr:helix-turn-helix domain-containing protein [Saccharophagus degradans]